MWFEWSCVVTSGVEWIWTDDRKLWITSEVPRICTMAELLNALTS